MWEEQHALQCGAEFFHEQIGCVFAFLRDERPDLV